jgi:hypothetical protein
MRFRKLQIAWSVVWGVVAVLLIVLWMRSYWWTDSAWRYTPNGGMRVDSLYGKIIFKAASRPTEAVRGRPSYALPVRRYVITTTAEIILSRD